MGFIMTHPPCTTGEIELSVCRPAVPTADSYFRFLRGIWGFSNLNSLITSSAIQYPLGAYIDLLRIVSVSSL